MLVDACGCLNQNLKQCTRVFNYVFDLSSPSINISCKNWLRFWYPFEIELPMFEKQHELINQLIIKLLLISFLF